MVLDPRKVEAHVALGRTLSQLGRPEEAREAYRAALAEAPGLPAALVGLGRLELEAGRPERAVASFEAALAADPGHRQALYNLAAALALLGRPEEAAAVRRRVRRGRGGGGGTRTLAFPHPREGPPALMAHLRFGFAALLAAAPAVAETSSSWTGPRKPESGSTTRTGGAAGAT